MSIFDKFIENGMIDTLRELGEPASIGGNQFLAAFNASNMSVARQIYGDQDEVTTEATCLKTDLSNKPRIGETLTRINKRRTYIVNEVHEDLKSYRLILRAKNG